MEARYSLQSWPDAEEHFYETAELVGKQFNLDRDGFLNKTEAIISLFLATLCNIISLQLNCLSLLYEAIIRRQKNIIYSLKALGYYSAQRSKNNTSMLPSRSYSFFHSTSGWHFDSTLTSSGLIPFGFVSKVAHHMSFVPGQSKEDTQEVVSFILKFIWDSIILTSNSFTNFLSNSLWKLNYSNGERDSHKLRDCFWSDRSIISCL